MSDNLEEGKQIIEIKKQEIAQMDELSNDIIQGANDAVEKADEMYQYMSDLIDISDDKSDATRQMMGKAVELRLMSNMQKIEILKIKAKLINPGKGNNNVNINLGTYDETKGSDTNAMIDIAQGLKRGMNAKIINDEEVNDEE